MTGGNSIGLGRVEIKINDIWAQICGDSWSIDDASVVCHYLGFNTTQQDITVGNNFGTSGSGYWVTEMQCSGKENDLNQCPYTLYDNSGPSATCAVGYPANVNCLGIYTTINNQNITYTGGTTFVDQRFKNKNRFFP